MPCDMGLPPFMERRGATQNRPRTKGRAGVRRIKTEGSLGAGEPPCQTQRSIHLPASYSRASAALSLAVARIGTSVEEPL